MMLRTLASFFCKKNMDLEKYFSDFKTSLMPDGFQWRKGQKEAIQAIVEAYFDKKYNTVILDAPVGSGKSIIGMCSSWILNQMNKKGYILASDISLQDQYEKDLERFKFQWGSVKGLDNYECIDNYEKVPMGTCKIQRKKAREMYCYEKCPYYSARDKAVISPTSSLNYAYWLTMMNEVNPKMEKPLFPSRDFTICDEAHKILDIIQNTYSPRFSEKTSEKLEKLVEFFHNHNVADLYDNLNSIKRQIMIMKEEENQDKLLAILARIVLDFSQFKDPISLLKKRVSNEYPKNPPKEWKRALYTSDWLEDFSTRTSEYVNIIQQTSIRNLIKNPNGDDIVFNCLEEKYLMHKYFHKHTGFSILMSATFSDPAAYLKGIALKGAKYIKLESQFDFSKSPIYFYNKRRMSYKHIENNLPWLIEKINNLIEKHEGESGLIHSASYKLSMDIYNGLTHKNRSRVLIYNGTEEKRNLLEEMKLKKDKILIGPSLLEGLDMKDDLSRFIIFAKTPYPNLIDKLVKSKMEKDPDWYFWKTSLSIIQGVGRGVRHSKDYCKIYYLDASLSDLLHKNRNLFPTDFLKRIIPISE
jgi:ATP-dependent DNA helicase DinG